MSRWRAAPAPPCRRACSRLRARDSPRVAAFRLNGRRWPPPLRRPREDPHKSVRPSRPACSSAFAAARSASAPRLPDDPAIACACLQLPLHCRTRLPRGAPRAFLRVHRQTAAAVVRAWPGRRRGVEGCRSHRCRRGPWPVRVAARVSQPTSDATDASAWSTVGGACAPAGLDGSHRRSVATSAVRSIGFVMWSFMPAARHASRSCFIALAVIAMMGRSRTPDRRAAPASPRGRPSPASACPSGCTA